jgi:hypothetical protein
MRRVATVAADSLDVTLIMETQAELSSHEVTLTSLALCVVEMYASPGEEHMTRLGHFRGIFGEFLGGDYAMMRAGVAGEESMGEPQGVAAHGMSGVCWALRRPGGYGDALQLWRLRA